MNPSFASSSFTNSKIASKRHRTLHSVWVAGIVVATGVTWWLLLTPPSGVSPMIRATVLGLGLFFLPGYLLRCLLLPGENTLTEIPLVFALSLGLSLLSWSAARLLGSGLNLFGYLAGSMVTALAALVILLRRTAGYQAHRVGAGERTRWEWLALIPLVLAVLFWTAIVFRVGASYMPRTDNWYYLAVVRRIIVTSHLAPGDPYFAGVADSERSGPWLALVALWAKQSGMELTALWDVLPALVMPLSLLAFYRLAWVIFRDRWIAALAVALTLAGRAGFTWNEPMMMAAPSNVALLLSFVGLSVAVEHSKRGQTAHLIAAVLLAGTVAAQHFLVFAGMLLMMGAFGIAQVGMGLTVPKVDGQKNDTGLSSSWYKASARIAVVLVLSLLVAIPTLTFWVRSSSGTTNPIYDDLWGLFKAVGPWHVLRVSSLSGGPHLFAFSFLLIPLLLYLARRNDWAMFLVALMTLVTLIAFTPPIVELILHTPLPPWGVWRLAAQIYPFQFTVAALACWGARQLRSPLAALFGKRRWLGVVVVAGITVLGWIPNVTPVAEPLMNYVQSARAGRTMKGPIAWLRHGPLAALPDEPSIVFSDVNTSFYISGLTGHYVVAIPYGHAAPQVTDDEERRDAVTSLLNDQGSVEEMRALLVKYHAGTVVLISRADLGEDTLSPEAWQYWVDTLDAAGSEFTLRFRDESDDHRAAVYSWQSAAGTQ